MKETLEEAMGEAMEDDLDKNLDVSRGNPCGSRKPGYWCSP